MYLFLFILKFKFTFYLNLKELKKHIVSFACVLYTVSEYYPMYYTCKYPHTYIYIYNYLISSFYSFSPLLLFNSTQNKFKLSENYIPATRSAFQNPVHALL